jgi:hypothetical protein
METDWFEKNNKRNGTVAGVAPTVYLRKYGDDLNA